MNPGCEVSASKFRAGASAVQTIRELRQPGNEFCGASSKSVYSHQDRNSRTPEFRYGAHFSAMGGTKHLRRPTLFTTNQKTALGISILLLFGVVTSKLSTDSARRNEAYEQWFAREEARKRGRESRPTLGKGRRNSMQNGSIESSDQ